MKEVLNNDAPLRRYLLGETAHDEELRVEERLLVDDDYMELLEVVEDELIDSYARGELKARQRRKFKQYFLVTPERQSKLRLATALVKHAGKSATAPVPSPGFLDRLRQLLPPSLPAPALGAALATLVIGAGFGIYWMLIYQSDIQKGDRALNEAYSQERPIEPRISSLNYAPFPVKRGTTALALTGANKLALDRAQRIFLDLASEKPGPASFHASGRYYLTIRDYDQAITQFESALEAGKEKSRFNGHQKAQIQSDYAAALMEKARSIKETDKVEYVKRMAESRGRLQEALKLKGQSPEALFNLGLWLQERRLWKEAEECWNKYLEVDSSSPWAAEAKKNRDIAIEEGGKQTALRPDQILRDFLNAYQANDKVKAQQVLFHNREPVTGRMVWWQLTEAFLDAAINGRGDQANHLLQALSYAGRLELEKGDRFTYELAQFYRSSSSPQHRLLAEAHKETNQGNTSCLDSNCQAALTHYKRAEELFKQAGDRLESLLPELMTGYCYQRDSIQQSILLLDQLARTCRNKNYLSLLVQVLNTTGAAHFNLNELSKSIKETTGALEVAARINDSAGAQKSLAQLANIHKYLDDFDQSLDDLNRCLDEAFSHWPGQRQMWRTYDTLAQVLVSLRFYPAAADYQKEAIRLASKDSQDQTFISTSYLRLGSIYGMLGDNAEAIRLAQTGFDKIPKTSKTTIAYALLQLGNLYRQARDFGQALAYYNQALNDAQGNRDLIYRARKGRLICFLAQKNDALAKDEIKQVLDITEEYRNKILAQDYHDKKIAERQKNTFFGAEQSFFDIAIDFEYSRAGNHQAAFELSEQSRARSLLDLISARPETPDNRGSASALLSSVTQPLKLNEIQAKLPEQSQILQYAALENRLLIWVISKTRFNLVEKEIRLSELQDKALDFWKLIAKTPQNKGNESDIWQKAKALHDILIAPVESQNLLDKGKTICVVTDKAINYLPFNALVSRTTSKPVLTEYRLTFAPSSTVFLLCTEWAQSRAGKLDERLLSVGNPSFDTRRYPALPASEREARNVSSYYRNPTLLLGSDAREATIKNLLNRFNVIHLATHYVVDDRSPLRSKLVLAQESASPDPAEQSDGMLQGEEIYGKKPLQIARLVVLSACRSGVEGYYNGEGLIGMSRTFIASGVPLVVASLWEVDSDATAELMNNFHKYRKKESYSTAEALRRAQLEMSKSQRYSHPNYWAPFIVIGGHAGY